MKIQFVESLLLYSNLIEVTRRKKKTFINKNILDDVKIVEKTQTKLNQKYEEEI